MTSPSFFAHSGVGAGDCARTAGVQDSNAAAHAAMRMNRTIVSSSLACDVLFGCQLRVRLDAERAPVRALGHDALERAQLRLHDAGVGADGGPTRRESARGLHHDAAELHD